MTAKLLKPFQEQKVPVAGFVNASEESEVGADGLRSILNLCLDAGAELGNHSYSHFNLNDVPLEEYTADILKGEPLLRSVLEVRGQTLRYYRHPFLHTGKTPEIKQGLKNFLAEHNYTAVPVTIDNDDYEFAVIYRMPEFHDRVRREYIPYIERETAFFEQRSKAVLGREIPKILLIHASQMNADLMPALLAMYRRRGYQFATLDVALADPAYSAVDGYAGPKGLSWIHKWGLGKGIPVSLEPAVPDWVHQAWLKSSR